MRGAICAAKAALLLLGIAALVHLVSVKCNRPLLVVAQVQGKSMQPSLNPGERIICVRTHWRQGDIVLADVGEEHLVVKRVAECRGWKVHLSGDNEQVSSTYWVSPQQIKSVMLCRLAVPSLPSTRAVAESSDGA